MLHDLPPHTSASQLGCYARCPRQYRMRYVEKIEPESKSANLALGTAVHGAVGWWFVSAKAGVEPTREDAMRVVRADLGAALASPEYKLDVDERAALFAEATRLLGLFLDHLAELEVVGVEERFEVPIVDPDTGNVLPRSLIGFIDLVLADGTLLELKTAARAYSAIDTATNLQFAAYRYVAREQRRPDVRLTSLIKTKTPKIQDLSLGAATDRSADWFVRAAVDIERAIHAGVFPPTPSAMSCSMCDYKGRCLGTAAEVERAEAA